RHSRSTPRLPYTTLFRAGIRSMNIHEYQAKSIFRDFNIPTLQGRYVTTVEDAVKAAEEIGGSVWVVKAQIHAGGRGKGGGVKLRSEEHTSELQSRENLVC